MPMGVERPAALLLAGATRAAAAAAVDERAEVVEAISKVALGGLGRRGYTRVRHKLEKGGGRRNSFLDSCVEKCAPCGKNLADVDCSSRFFEPQKKSTKIIVEQG